MSTGNTGNTGTEKVAGPGLRQQSGLRTLFRVLGVVMAPLGVLLLAVGFYRFVTFDPSGWDAGPPDGVLMFALGGVLAVTGFGFLNAGFMGASARYTAGETMPVVKDSATYLSDGEGILGVGRTVDDQHVTQRAAAGPYCRSCGVRNDEDAKFCDGCGTALA
jgi:hypothetical protein